MKLQQNTNVKVLVECWKASTGKMEKNQSEEQQADIWNKRSGEFARFTRDKKGRKRSLDILRFLEEAGFRAKGAKVLDIGCGPGTLSIPLARAGADVTSLDIAPGMLEELKEYADAEKIAVHPLECSWWTADIDKLGFRNKFDLVIASMTPGVKDVETLDRMMACSKNYCYYSNFLGGGRSGNRRMDISRILGREKHVRTPRVRQGSGLMFPFLYLYALGYRPLIRFSQNRWKEETSWQEAADRAIRSLEYKETCDPATKRRIYAYYKANSEDGKFQTGGGMYTGILVWMVNNENMNKKGCE